MTTSFGHHAIISCPWYGLYSLHSKNLIGKRLVLLMYTKVMKNLEKYIIKPQHAPFQLELSLFDVVQQKFKLHWKMMLSDLYFVEMLLNPKAHGQ